MNNLNFETPWMLALLWLVPLAAFGLVLLRARRKRRSESWVSPVMQAKLLPKPAAWRYVLQLSLLGLGFLCAFLALARPRWGEVTEIVNRQGRDLMIVLDVSRSMLATDVMPNRLERAKADLIDLIGTLSGDRAGLILFRHKAVQICPLTTDYGFLLQMLDGASPDSAPPGETDIGDSIYKALDALDIQQSAHQAIVLVSDGEDLAEKVQDAAEKAKSRGVTIFTVGFGSLSGSAIPDAAGGRVSYKGAEVTSKLNPDTLRKIAAKTGGVYVPVGTARVDLGDLYRNHLRKLATRELDESVFRRQVERFAWFLLPAILFWLVAGAFSPGRPLLRAAGKTGLKTAAIWVVVLLASAAQAADSADQETADPQRLARIAQDLYRQGKYPESADAFKKAAAQNEPRAAARDLYNAGCALYAAGRFQEAVEAFRAGEAARMNPSIPSRYNEGCGLLQAADASDTWKTNAAAARARAELIEAAAKAFQEALPLESKTRVGATQNNLNLAADRAENARRQAHEIKLEETYGHMNAGQIAQQLLETQRRIGPEVAAAFSNDTPSQITQLESIAASEREAADMMTPLTRKLEEALQQSASGTNAAQQAAQFRQYAAALKDLMSQTADKLRDADPVGLDMLPAGERASYSLWKGIAPFDLILREDIRVQSNAVLSAGRFRAVEPPPAEAKSLIRDQDEAGQLTRLFSERFEKAVPEGGLPAEPPQPGSQDQTEGTSNAPAISAENRAKILKLASRAGSMQADAVKAGNEKDWAAFQTLARDSHALLKEIEDLLPKQKQSSSSQDKQQDQKQDQQKPKPDDPKKDQQKPDPQQNQENKPEQKPDNPPETEEQKKEEMSQEKARAILEKARLREKEYLDEKQKRAFFDRAPSDRDW
jgi:Ca-activated chloride channel family protein